MGKGLPKFIGDFCVLEELGEGWMTVVYLAQQERPIHRCVALTVIKLGVAPREVSARFESEHQTLALMNPPHIAKVLDVDTTTDVYSFLTIPSRFPISGNFAAFLVLLDVVQTEEKILWNIDPEKVVSHGGCHKSDEVSLSTSSHNPRPWAHNLLTQLNVERMFAHYIDPNHEAAGSLTGNDMGSLKTRSQTLFDTFKNDSIWSSVAGQALGQIKSTLRTGN